MDISWIVILPTILTIIVCLWTRKIFVGMFAGIFSASIIICGGDPLKGLDMSFNKLIGVASSSWNMKIILFATLIGGIIKLMQVSGGVRGLINWLENKASITTPAKAQFFTWLIGVVLFFDQYTSEAVTATIGKTLAKKYGYSSAKVAYFVDSTASPMCAFLPLNSWGAYIIGLLASVGVKDAMPVLVKTLPLNFYCISALLICLIVALKNWNIGPMKNVEMECKKNNGICDDMYHEDEKAATPLLVIIPIFTVIISVIVGQFITGKGIFSNGDTSTAVFYSMIIANVVIILMCIACGMKSKDAIKYCGEGVMEMIPVAMLLVFAFCLSSICSELKIGAFISQMSSMYIPKTVLPALVFITAALMAFATGSSWGTFAIMIPIIVPMAHASLIPYYLLLAPTLSGAIMGDHCSIISDSTVMASAFSGCDNVSHFETQLPYALISASIATILYLITGLVRL